MLCCFTFLQLASLVIFSVQLPREGLFRFCPTFSYIARNPRISNLLIFLVFSSFSSIRAMADESELKHRKALQLHDKNAADTKPKKPKKKKKKNLINVAPLDTPLHRRLETLSVMWHTVSIPSFCCLFLFILYLGWLSWVFIVIPYFIWLYGFDLHTPTNGKVVYRIRNGMRNLIIWKWFVDYYPIRVHKTCELEPTFTTEVVLEESTPDDEEDLISEDARTTLDRLFKFFGLKKRLNDLESSSAVDDDEDARSTDSKSSTTVQRHRKVGGGPRYIFCYHPHGVISMGAMGLFATNALRNQPFKPPAKFLKPFFHDPSKEKELFPGIGHAFPLTLTTQFTIPFYRDYLLSLGLTSASGRNIKSVIKNGDNSVCLVIGGAQESLLNDMVGENLRVGVGYQGHESEEEEPEEQKPKRQIKLVLNKRKGFVKIALELGNVSLVPTFAFGEADIYRLAKPKEGSLFHAFQLGLKRLTLFTLPFFSARGVFIYDFGFLPFRTPINICTGRPVYVPAGLVLQNQEEPAKDTEKDKESARSESSSSGNSSLLKKFSMFKGKEKPKKRSKPHISQELLDHYHGLYIEELKKVYEENKHLYGYGDVELVIVE